MKKSFLSALAILAVFAVRAAAQNSNSTNSNYVSGDSNPSQGTMELLFSGSGSSNKKFNDSLGGANVALGYYFSPDLEGQIRQMVSYSKPHDHSSSWDGATRVALDALLMPGQLRPFVGANFGGIYGDSVRDTWAAGLEGGAKYYVLPRTFLQAALEYDWFFEHSHGITDRFSDGEWNWTLGVGYNF